jgi:putative intracellular protease/amidase
MPTYLLTVLTALSALALQPSTSPIQEPAPEVRTRTVAILVFPGVELLDFAGPGEVFAAARIPGTHAFDVVTVASSKEPVSSMGFASITPQHTFDDCPKPDIVVVPGGSVPLEDAKLLAWVRARAKDTELMMSVCNGALVYAAAGLLEGLEVTTHRSALQNLALLEPSARVHTNRRFVDNGRVLTCAGVSAGIDGALHVVARMCGEDQAWATARYMEYDWRPDELARLHAQPGTPVDGSEALELVGSIRKLGLEGALAELRKLEPQPVEQDLNRWGYSLLRTGRRAEAIDVFRLTAAAFPVSSNAADSLSEALEQHGASKDALLSAKDCLARLEKDTALEEQRRAILHNSAASRVARLSGASPDKLRYVCAPCSSPCDELAYLEATRCPGCPMELVERDPAPR